jgi:hypothetical protein
VQAAGIDELHAASKSARKIADLMHNLLWSPFVSSPDFPSPGPGTSISIESPMPEWCRGWDLNPHELALIGV